VARSRTLLQVSAPIVAIATLMLGLRVGAKDAIRAAAVYGAPPARTAPGQKTLLAWQLKTVVDDRGVSETITVPNLTVVARAKGQESRWTGATNEDGIAEITLAFDGLVANDDVDLEVRAEGDPVPLAEGRASWDRSIWRAEGRDEIAEGAVRPTKRGGNVSLDVVVEGDRLITGFATPTWVRAGPPLGVSPAGVEIEVVPEPGLRADHDKVTTCDSGWAEVGLIAEAHVTGGGFKATVPNHAEATGEWFGGLPVAAGSFFPSIDRVIAENKPATAVLIAPNPRTVVYTEIDDASGRAFAAALPVVVEPGDPTPRARLAIPPLAAGLHWLVVSGEPLGATTLAGATIARPFVVGTAPGVNVQNACDVGPWLARHPASGFPRWIALDGMPARSAGNRGKHRLGLLIGVVALLAAGILETLLLVAASREARIALQLAELDDDATGEKVTARPPGGGLAIAICVAMLGFALLAALIVAKG
jgi:hypothetical protein